SIRQLDPGAYGVGAVEWGRLDPGAQFPGLPSVAGAVHVGPIVVARPRVRVALVQTARAAGAGAWVEGRPAPPPLEVQEVSAGELGETRALDSIPVVAGDHHRRRPDSALVGRPSQNIVEARVGRAVQDLGAPHALHEGDQPFARRQPEHARVRAVRERIAVDDAVLGAEGLRRTPLGGRPHPLIPALVAPPAGPPTRRCGTGWPHRAPPNPRTRAEGRGKSSETGRR